MSRAGTITIPYDTSLRSLTGPAKAGEFFRRYRPESKAAWCAEFSRLAYCTDHAVLVSSLEYVGFELIAAFDQRGTEGILARGPAFSVLAFRGSNELRDWVTNLDAVPAPWRGGGKAHRGFTEALDRVWPNIEAALQQERIVIDRPRDQLRESARHHKNTASSPILFTGHSLGAALATLAASLFPKATLITFGSPRVGDSGFHAAMARRPGAAKRFVNNRDIVCRLPSARLGYRHVGEPWLIDAGGRVTQRSPRSRGLAGLLWDGLRNGNTWATGDLPRELTDHSPMNYVLALR